MADDPGETEMPSPLKSPSDLIAEAHEDRIQRLEQTVSETSTKVATIEQKIESGFQYIGEKMESTMKPVADKLAAHVDDDKELNKKVSAVVDQISDSKNRIEKLEDTAGRRKARWDTIKKVAGALALALVGAAFKACFDHMSGK